MKKQNKKTINSQDAYVLTKKQRIKIAKAHENFARDYYSEDEVYSRHVEDELFVKSYVQKLGFAENY